MLSSELPVQAKKFQVKLEESGEEMVLPVVSESGEYAALFQMVSDGTVSIAREWMVICTDHHRWIWM